VPGAPTNLNRVRKARARAAAKRTADANAVKFGRTKAERGRDRAEAARAAREHDAHRRDTGRDGEA